MTQIFPLGYLYLFASYLINVDIMIIFPVGNYFHVINISYVKRVSASLSISKPDM